LGDSDPHQVLHEPLWQRRVNRKPERPLRRLVGGYFICERREHGTTVGEVAEVVLERRKPGDDLSSYSERRKSVGDPLFGLGGHFTNRLAQALQSGPLRFFEVDR